MNRAAIFAVAAIMTAATPALAQVKRFGGLGQDGNAWFAAPIQDTGRVYKLNIKVGDGASNFAFVTFTYPVFDARSAPMCSIQPGLGPDGNWFDAAGLLIIQDGASIGVDGTPSTPDGTVWHDIWWRTAIPLAPGLYYARIECES